MVFKGTSDKRRSCYAVTLIELLIASSIVAVLSTAICTSLVFSSRSLVGLSNYIEMDGKSRNSLDNFMVDLRDMQKILSLVSNSTTTTLKGLRWSNDVQVAYGWTKDSTTLQRFVVGEQTKTLLTNCEALVFNLFQRSPTTGWRLQETDAAHCKYVQVSWTCRKSVGSAQDNVWNTETVQTAGIMLRNQH